MTAKPLGTMQKPLILSKAQPKQITVKDLTTSNAGGSKTASSSKNKGLGNSSSSTASETASSRDPLKTLPSSKSGDRSGGGVASKTSTVKGETRVIPAPGKGEKNGGAKEEVSIETQSKEAVTGSGTMDKTPSTDVSSKDLQEEEVIAQDIRIGKEKVKGDKPSSRSSATPPPSSSPSNSEDKSAPTTVNKRKSPANQTVPQAEVQLVSPVIFSLPQWKVMLSGCKAGPVVMTTVQSSLSTSTAKTTPTLASSSVNSSTVMTVSDEVEADKDDTTTTIEDTQMEVDNDKTKETHESEVKTGSDDEIKKGNYNKTGSGNKVEVSKDKKMNVQDAKSITDNVEAINNEKKQETTRKDHTPLDVPIPHTDQTEVGVDLEDPLLGVKSRDKHVTEHEDLKSILLTTPTHRRPSEDGCPTGILKHVSQFDTPSSTTKVCVWVGGWVSRVCVCVCVCVMSVSCRKLDT